MDKTKRDMLERNYSKAANALQVLIEEEGCCNALRPFSDALDEIKPKSSQEEINIFYMQEVIPIVAGLFDIDFEETTGADRVEKIRSAVIFLIKMEREHEA